MLAESSISTQFQNQKCTSSGLSPLLLFCWLRSTELCNGIEGAWYEIFLDKLFLDREMVVLKKFKRVIDPFRICEKPCHHVSCYVKVILLHQNHHSAEHWMQRVPHKGRCLPNRVRHRKTKDSQWGLWQSLQEIELCWTCRDTQAEGTGCASSIRIFKGPH